MFCKYHEIIDRRLVVLVILVTMVVEEVHLLVLVAVSTVVLMAIGPETAQQETGRTNVTVVGKEVTLRGTAKTVLVQRRPGTYIFESFFLHSFFNPFEVILIFIYFLDCKLKRWKLLQVTS